MTNKKALIVAGGTGGHIFPGLAVARELQKRNFSVEWLGTQKGLEARLIPEAGIVLHTVDIDGVRGRGIKGLLVAPFKIFRSTRAVMKLIREIDPVVVVGFGGYVAGPAGVASWLAGKPLFIHEQNAVAGTTNKLLTRLANKVFTAFPNIFDGAECVGNPVREQIYELPAPEERIEDEPECVNILVLGGSRGALAINQVVPEALSKLVRVKIKVWHQAGKDKDQATREAYDKTEVDVKVTPFIDDMVEAYRWAHLVICRSGALTISELAAVGVGSILIPFPYAIDDHQTENARYLVDDGAAILKPQLDLSASALAKELSNILNNKKMLKNMAVLAKKKDKQNAAGVIADHCEEILNA